MTSFSIAMATYNGARFLIEQLMSIQKQTRKPDELVVSDDGSTDDTIVLLEDFSRTAPFPVRLHRNGAKLGYRANFMKSASLCSGDLIAFSDQDDVWFPEKLALQELRLAEPGVLLSTHDVELADVNGKGLGTTYRQHRLEPRMAAWNAPPFCFNLGFTLAFRRELLAFSKDWPLSRDEYFEGELAAHDQWFCFLALALGSMSYDAVALAHYRQHGRNAFGAHSSQGAPKRGILDVASRSDDYTRRANAALSRCNQAQRMLEQYKTSTSLEYSRQFYRTYANSLIRRRDMLTTRSLPLRMSRFLSSVARGDYLRDRKKSFGLRATARDLQLILKTK